MPSETLAGYRRNTHLTLDKPFSFDDNDYFANAKELYLPPPLLAFKLHSMVRRDYKVRNPMDLQSGFLGNNRNMW